MTGEQAIALLTYIDNLESRNKMLVETLEEIIRETQYPTGYSFEGAYEVNATAREALGEGE